VTYEFNLLNARGLSKLHARLKLWLNKLDSSVRKHRAGDLQLTGSPDHLLSDADLVSGMVQIDTMDEQAYRKSVFLDAARPDDFHRAKGGLWTVDFRDLPDIVNSIPGLDERQLHLISHPGFCGSTLLANLLEHLGAFCVYREPVIWRRLTDLWYKPAYSDRYSERQLREICNAVFQLFSRTWRPDEQAVVKSVPGAMGLDLVAHQFMPASRCLYIRPRLESYLAAVFKHETERMWWVEQQLGHEWLWSESPLEGLKVDMDHLPRHLKIALYWKLHTSAMERQQAALPASSLTISSDDFFADKRETLIQVIEHFGQTIDEDEIHELMQSDIVSRYSKQSSRRYSDSDRLREEADALANRKTEIDEAESWISSL
jgi:hypothetical protein